MKICRHCKVRIANRPRTLCWGCYYTPEIRDKFPVHFKVPDKEETESLVSKGPATDKTSAWAGSEEKIAVLQKRYAEGTDLFHPEDERHMKDSNRCPHYQLGFARGRKKPQLKVKVYKTVKKTALTSILLIRNKAIYL